MSVKSPWFRVIYVACFVTAGIVAAYRLPAYSSRMPWLILLMFSDIYLLFCESKTDFRFYSRLRMTLIVFTIIPSAALISFLLSMAFLSPVEWNPILRTYLLGLVVLFYVLRIFPLCVFLFFDLRKVISQFIFRKNPVIRHLHRPLIISLWISIIAGVFYFSGMLFWVYDYQVVEKQIFIKGLPEAYDGYRIVQLSDIHLGRWHSGKPLQRAVTMVNSLDPELIVFTGDLVNYATTEAYAFKDILGSMKAHHGIYAVLGNHDYGDYMRWADPPEKEANIQKMKELLNEIGWILLDNQHVILNRGGSDLAFAGVGNFSSGGHYPNRADLATALSGIPDSCCIILLSHDPRIINDTTLNFDAVDLILSGHTHALQLGLILGNKEFSPASFVYKHWGGHYNTQAYDYLEVQMYVNRGLGHIGFPARIGIKPEITLIILRPEK